MPFETFILISEYFKKIASHITQAISESGKVIFHIRLEVGSSKNSKFI